MSTQKEPSFQDPHEAWKPREISPSTISSLGEKSLGGVVAVGAGPEVQTPALIDGVPGITRTEGTQPSPGTERTVVSNIDFKGDPRRVIGHPANETSQMTQAYIDSQNK